MCSGIYAAIIVVFCVGISLHHSLYIREGLYLPYCLPCCSSILRLSLSAAVISLPKNSWTRKRKAMPWRELNIGMGGALSAKQYDSADSTESLQTIPDERRDFIQKSLDDWCANLGYKDCNVNILTLSRTLCISKNELSQFFDQCLHSNFRIWLSEIRFNAAKKMMLEYPDYTNDIISAECGFSCRTHLYRIFKTKEGCSPTEWRDFQSTYAAQNDSN